MCVSGILSPTAVILGWKPFSHPHVHLQRSGPSKFATRSKYVCPFWRVRRSCRYEFPTPFSKIEHVFDYIFYGIGIEMSATECILFCVCLCVCVVAILDSELVREVSVDG